MVVFHKDKIWYAIYLYAALAVAKDSTQHIGPLIRAAWTKASIRTRISAFDERIHQDTIRLNF